MPQAEAFPVKNGTPERPQMLRRTEMIVRLSPKRQGRLLPSDLAVLCYVIFAANAGICNRQAKIGQSENDGGFYLEKVLRSAENGGTCILGIFYAVSMALLNPTPDPQSR